MTAVICEKVSKSYKGKQQALQGVSCAFAAEAITGLIGPNGAGKTTLLKIIAGFLRPTGGEVRVFGRVPFESLGLVSHVIMVDDTMVFPSSMNMGRILKLAAVSYPHWDQALAERLTAYFDLGLEKYPQQLSKGMLSTFKSIVGICAHAPLTILDEPITGMDAGVRQDFYRALLKDYIACPRTIIISSHLLGEIEELLEDIVLIANGQMVLAAPVAEMQQYALRLIGQAQALEPWADRADLVLRQEQQLAGQLQLVVRNTLTQQERASLLAAQVQLSPLSANELCVLLGNQRKGGIDDVFN